MQSAQNMDELFDKFLNRNCSTDELQQLFHHFHTSDETLLRKMIESELLRPGSEADVLTEAQRAQVAGVHKHIKAKLFAVSKTRGLVRRLLPYAAAVIVFCMAGIYYWYSQTGGADLIDSNIVSQFGEEIAPGGNKATVTLPDGTVIELDEDKEGIVVSGDTLVYSDGDKITATSPKVEYATLSTPRGGQYQLTLPDGSKVWLNAESSITYPTTFNGKQRIVKIRGEAYFDVAKDKTKPFIVESDAQQITVTGTQFNINTYTDEPVSATTLVEGQVKIKDNNSGKSAVLAPGQQAVSGEKELDIRTVDTNVYTAWKDGYFVFERTELSKILRQLSRWYDVEIDYSGVPEQTLTARVQRDKSISSVLNAIAKTTGLNFYIKERKMILRK